MRLKRKINQHRRDFEAVYECEHCGNEQTGKGYDDQYFHVNVIPIVKCKRCGQRAPQWAPMTQPDVAEGEVL